MTQICMTKRYKRRGCGTEVRLLATDIRHPDDYVCLYVQPKGHAGYDALILTRADGSHLGPLGEHPNDLIEVQPTLFGLRLGGRVFKIRSAETRSDYVHGLYSFERIAINEGRLTVVEIKTTQE